MYVVFAGRCFYPGGGWHDFISFEDDLVEATREAYRSMEEIFKKSRVDEAWCQVVLVDDPENGATIIMHKATSSDGTIRNLLSK